MAILKAKFKAPYIEPTAGPRRDGLNKLTIGNSGEPRKNPHRGSDWGGKLITSISTGRVTEVFFSEQLGNCLTMKNADGVFILYAHMAKPSSRKVGDMVVAGETAIGLVGNTGSYSFGAHLHAAAAKHKQPHLAPQGKLLDLFTLIDGYTASVKAA
jgi:murein DD-endopeptidase MepM/ murein hydrolase activator NlpD